MGLLPAFAWAADTAPAAHRAPAMRSHSVSGSAAAGAVRRDSLHTVRRITIGSNGIQIDGNDAGATAPADGGEVVRIGHGRVVVSTDRDSQHVRRRVLVNGPVVVVDDGESGLVRVFADAEVPAAERIEGDVVAVFGSVRVKGHVAGNVAAVFGSVVLEPGSIVDGDVVAVGGALDQQTGAVVNGQSVSLGLFSWQPGIPTLPVLLGTVFACWALTMLFGSLLLVIFPRRVQRVARTAAERTGGAFVLGIASAPLVVIAIVLLMITVVGIPFAIVLPLAYVFSVWSGQLAATTVLGCRLLRRPIDGGSAFAPLAAGTSFVALFFVLGAVLSGPQGSVRTIALFFTLLGILLIVGLSVVGTGAVLLSRFGSRPRDAEMMSAGPAAVAPPPPPSPLPAVPIA